MNTEMMYKKMPPSLLFLTQILVLLFWKNAIQGVDSAETMDSMCQMLTMNANGKADPSKTPSEQCKQLTCEIYDPEDGMSKPDPTLESDGYSAVPGDGVGCGLVKQGKRCVEGECVDVEHPRCSSSDSESGNCFHTDTEDLQTMDSFCRMFSRNHNSIRNPDKSPSELCRRLSCHIKDPITETTVLDTTLESQRIILPGDGMPCGASGSGKVCRDRKCKKSRQPGWIMRPHKNH